MTPTGWYLAGSALLLTSAALPAAVGADADEALQAVRSDQLRRIEVMARAAPSVVCIFDETRSGAGAGVVISADGYGLTNFHVVAGMLKTRRGLGGMSDGKLYPLEVLGVDPTGDVAMFRLRGKERFAPAPLGDSDQLRPGDPVFAAGNPFALAEDYNPTITRGIVSGLNRYQFGGNQRSLVYTDCIQVDASINPGNSGGPLFDMHGRVVGINGRASFEHRGRVNVGLGYAISINQIKRFMPGLRAGLLVEHGSLGATTIDLGYRRVVFEKVLEPSAASAAGIAVGDRLLHFAGREIHSSNQFASLLGGYPAGWPVEVLFEHDGQRVARTIHLERLPAKMDEPFHRDEAVTRAGAHRYPPLDEPLPRPPANLNLLTPVIERANRSAVKIYGAGIAGQPGYGTGVIVSPDGLVVTVLSLLLEATRLRVVTHDGHVHPAQVTYRDQYRQLAMLKMTRFPQNVDTAAPVRRQMAPARHEPYPMSDSKGLRSGDWILVVGNPFKVADGQEPLSVMKGIVSGRGPLDAVRGTEPFPYRGEVILLDAITSSPGSPGSAVVTLDGRWVGLVGRIVKSRLTNTFLNYAYPIEQIEAFVDDAGVGTRPATRPAMAAALPGYHGIRLSRIGYRKRLPFVKSVVRGSPAEAAGVRPDDLIVSANGVAIPQARTFTELCQDLRPGDQLSLIIKRAEQLIPIRMILTEPPP